MENNPLKIQEIYWQDVRTDLIKLNPKLTEIIDALNPGKKFPLYKTAYPYGSYILNKGKFLLPKKNGTFISLNDKEVDPVIQKNLGYNPGTNPALIVLENILELLVPLKDRLIPYFYVKPGSLFGTWKVLDESPTQKTSYDPCSMWDLTSGARSLFMLPKISERIGHSKLQKKFNFSLDKPKQLIDHWYIFKALYNHYDFKEKWETTVLMFSSEWFKHLNDKAWKEFRLYLLEFNWKCTEYWRSQYVWNLTLSRIQQARSIKPSAYYTDIVKHLFAIGVGALPGFTPAIDDSIGPIRKIQEIYLDVYGLKQWAPLIMYPCKFDMYAKNQCVYYSLQFPTSIELAPKPSERSSAINDIYILSSLFEKYIREIQKGYLNVEQTPVNEVTRLTQFDFIHSEPGDYPRIKNSETIHKDDNEFTKSMQTFNDDKFPKYSTFFNGCIQIRNKQEI